MFCNFTPDAAVVMMMLVILMEFLVQKGVLKKEEVSEISVKAGEILNEVQKNWNMEV